MAKENGNEKKKVKLTVAGKLLAVVFAVALIFLITQIVSLIHTFNKAVDSAETITATVAPTPVPTEESTSLQEQEYKERYAINSEYIGVISFDSGLITQPVVQNLDGNEKYLNLSWNLQESSQGAAFIDYRNTTSDQNIIIYGHYVYKDNTAMFSKLELLVDEENYDANKYITLTVGPKENRRYLITDVYYYDMNSDSPKYYETEYDTEAFNTYYTAVKEADFYDTGETLTVDNHWLTLQTCVRNHSELREIVLAKEVDE